MFQRIACFLGLIVLLSTLSCWSETLSGTITINTSLAPGEHVISGTVLVAPGVALEFAALSTVRFSEVSATLLVAGTLRAQGTMFTGADINRKWGQIHALPGSTCLFTTCQMDNGGGDQLPPPALSNAVLYGEGAAVLVSNTVITRPQGDCVAFRGGTVAFVQNVVTSTAPGYGYYAAVRLEGGAPQPTTWRSSGNSLLGWPLPGIWVEGTFTHDLDLAPSPPERLHLATVVVTNARMTVAAGATVALNDYGPGAVTIGAGGALLCQGTPAAPILWTNFFGINPWPGIKWLPGSTGIMSSTILTRASRHTLSNAYVSLANVQFIHLENGLSLTDYSRLEGNNVLFHGMFNSGVSIQSHSTLFLRQCQFLDNHAPFINSLAPDNTAGVDARFCWWAAPDGPYPFGDYHNQHVLTNATSDYFPWLLAAPGSQTNPPYVRITSHAEPFVTTNVQVVISGIATDNTGFVRLELRNGRCPITLQPSFNYPYWQAQIWLYSGVNPIAVYAYDNEGNASVDAVLINCTGAGVGTGGAVPPVLEPLGTRHAIPGKELTFGVVATSPTEPAIMTYWAANLPGDANFDSIQSLFTWTPQQVDVGTYNNIAFFVTDGGSVATTLCTIVVSTTPTQGVRAGTTPDMYAYQPYFYMMAPDSTTAPLDWRFSSMFLPDGVVASRSGIICGVPLTLEQTPIPFDVRAINIAGVSSATVADNINRYSTDTGAKLRVLSYDLPAVLAGTPLVYQFTGTNGLPPVIWQNVNGDCPILSNALQSSGALTSVIAVAGMHPATILMIDATNRTYAANIVLPIVATEQQLRFVPKKNTLSIFISQNPTKTRKSTITLKATFEALQGFTLTSNDLAACRVGFVLCDAGMPFKAKLNKKNLFIQNLPSRYTKIQVNQMSKGMLKFSCTIKNADLRLHLAQYGIINATVPALHATVPVWIQIGTRMTLLQQVPVVGKAKLNSYSKAKAKW